MAKDPAFLFYSKDWIQGTAEMLPEEKGIYIDLLAHQHQTGSLPVEIRRLALICRVSNDQFENIWNSGLSQKFYENGGRLYNNKLVEVCKERSLTAKKHRIAGMFAKIIKDNKLNDNQRIALRKAFKVDEFVGIEDENIEQSMTKWYTKWYTKWCQNTEDGDGIGDEDVLNTIVENPFGQEGDEMWESWKEYKRTEHKAKYKSQKTEQTAINKLYKISNGNIYEAKQIIENSIANQWKGLFELSSKNNKSEPENKRKLKPLSV